MRLHFRVNDYRRYLRLRTRYPNAANANAPTIAKMMTRVARSRPAAAIPVNAFRIRGTAFLIPVTSGASIVGAIVTAVGRIIGVGGEAGVGIAVGVSGMIVGVGVLVGTGVGVGV